MFSPIFEKKIQGRKHPERGVIAELIYETYLQKLTVFFEAYEMEYKYV